MTGTPEELIIDFGLNTQPMGVPSEPIEITERIVMNYYTAKRMMTALQMSLQRHEAAFGVLETDVQKRVMPGVMRQPPPPALEPDYAGVVIPGVAQTTCCLGPAGTRGPSLGGLSANLPRVVPQLPLVAPQH